MTNFEQCGYEYLYDSWKKFKLMLNRFLSHGLDDMEQVQIFTPNLRAQICMFLGELTLGTMRSKLEAKVKELIENMAKKWNHALTDRYSKGNEC